MDHRNLQRVDVTGDLAKGLQAYAQTQGDLQQALKEHFCAIWQSPLADSDDISELEENDKDNGEDDDDNDNDEDGDDGAEGDDLEGIDGEDTEELG